jgi:ubiquitin carboxyl-terminal hydrolase L5
MLNANVCLQQESVKYEKAQKQRSAKKRTPPKGKKSKKTESEEGFHYIAYVPVNGSVWRFDGLLQQPMNIGKDDAQSSHLGNTDELP